MTTIINRQPSSNLSPSEAGARSGDQSGGPRARENDGEGMGTEVTIACPWIEMGGTHKTWDTAMDFVEL